jgi:hypothetical protein
MGSKNNKDRIRGTDTLALRFTLVGWKLEQPETPPWMLVVTLKDDLVDGMFQFAWVRHEEPVKADDGGEVAMDITWRWVTAAGREVSPEVERMLWAVTAADPRIEMLIRFPG